MQSAPHVFHEEGLQRAISVSLMTENTLWYFIFGVGFVEQVGKSERMKRLVKLTRL